MSGRVRFGPDAHWIKNETGQGTADDDDVYAHEHGLSDKQIKINYQVDLNRASDFYSSIRNYYPSLSDDSLVPAYAGIRPKLCGPQGEGFGSGHRGTVDFVIDTPQKSGVHGLVNLFGIESPGLTSSLAIGDYVASQV
jgi:L-2-hydroxyglutarate oxidase LhgO